MTPIPPERLLAEKIASLLQVDSDQWNHDHFHSVMSQVESLLREALDSQKFVLYEKFNKDGTRERFSEGYEQAVAAERKKWEGVAIVTSDEGTSYCKFCNQLAKTVEEERERCAKIAEEHSYDDKCLWHCSLLIADKIRGLGK